MHLNSKLNFDISEGTNVEFTMMTHQKTSLNNARFGWPERARAEPP